MGQQLKNFASTPLDGAINDSVTSIVVVDGSVFPATGDFYVQVDNEIMLVTARTTETLTVTRAQEGTAASTHVTSSLVKLTLSAATWDGWFGDLVTFGGYASRPSSPKVGQRYYATDIDLGWRYDGSNWDLIHPVYVPYSKRVDVSSWTAFNHGTSAWSNIHGVLCAQLPTSAGSNLRGYYKSIPSAPFTANVICRVKTHSQQFNIQGLILTNTTAYNTLGTLTIGNTETVDTSRYTNITTSNSNQYRKGVRETTYMWFKIHDDNTNWLYSYSHDGMNYHQVFSATRNTFLTATHVGLFCNRVETTWPSTAEYQFLAYWET